MSITSVNTKIKTAMKDGFISTAEAKTIVKEAERGPVTVGEGKAVAALFDKAPRAAPPGMMVTMAIPEHPGDVTFEAGAKNVLEMFFTKNNVPAGANLAKTIAKVEAKLDESGWGPSLATAPNTKKMHVVHLPYPAGAADLPGRTAYVDTKKNEFYLKVSGGLMAPNMANTRWYGPTSLDTSPAPASDVSAARAAQLKGAFDKLDTAGTLAWNPGGVIEQHLGVRFAQVQLHADGFPDGYTYTAFVPLGALTPTAPQKDPNTVTEFYVQRSGGFAGITQSVGPLTLAEVATTLSDARKGVVQSKLDTVKNSASWSIQSGLMNERTVEVKLKSDATYNYTAIVPVGPTNPSPALDPNTVNDVVVMRLPKVIPPNVRLAPEYTRINLLPGNGGHGPREAPTGV